jgi:hypothetical protein
MRQAPNLLVPALTLLVAGAAASAQDAALLDLAPAKLKLSAEPALWYMAPGGDIRFPTTTGAPTQEVNGDDINMDSPRLSPFFELNINAPRWGATFRGVTMSANSRGFTPSASVQLGDTLLAGGTTAESSLDYLQLEAEARYALFPYWQDLPETRATKPWQTFDHRLDLVAGVRLIDFSLDVTQTISGTTSPVASADETFIMPYAGFKGAVLIEEKLSMDVTSSMGGIGGFGGQTGFAWDIMVGFQYHFTPNFGAQIGYRQTLFRLSDSDTQFRWNGAQAGLYFGVVGRF